MSAEFQFLIGRLQTFTSNLIPGGANGVSIPHRQATNDREPNGTAGKPYVSIPHRQATNHLQVLQRINFWLVSIPHRQATNKTGAYKGFSRECSFNSSQVGYKRDIHIHDLDFFGCFNSSQVGYKRQCLIKYGPKILGFNSSQVGYKQKLLTL